MNVKNLLIVFSICLFLVGNCNAQWMQLGPSGGGNIAALAVSDSFVFAGTLNYSYGGNGVYRSTDNGANWMLTSLDNINIRSLAVSGSNVFAGNENGVYRSTDNGENWTQTSLNNRIFSLAVSGSNVFAGTEFNGLYKSTDNGESWSQTSLNNNYGIPSLLISGPYIFAGTENYYTNGDGVYFSSDNGETWIQTSLNNERVYSLASAGSNVFAGTYDGIYRSTDNGETWFQSSLNTAAIYALTVNGLNIFAAAAWYSGQLQSGLYRSTDNGETWMLTQTAMDSLFVNSLAFSGSNVIAGTDDGVYSSKDFGQIWTCSIGINLKFIYAIATIGSNVFSGTAYYNGSPYIGYGIYRSTNNGDTWPLTSLYHKNINTITTMDPNVFAGTYEGVYRSTDNGENWTLTSLNDNYVSSLAANSSNVFAGTGGVPPGAGVFRSTDNGVTWLQSSLDSLNVPSLATNNSNVFAGTGYYNGYEYLGNGVYRSTDNGETWLQTSLDSGYISSLAISGSDVFAGTFGKGVYGSTDNGETWVQTSLDSGYISSLAVSGSNVFAGTFGTGVYRSTDNGETWSQVNEGMGNRTILSLTTSSDYLYAGTAGTSAWRIPLSEIVIPVELKSFIASTNGKEVILNWSTATETNNQGFDVQRSIGKRTEVGSQRSEWEKIGFVEGSGTTAKTKEYSFIDKNVSTGTYSYRLKQIDFDGTYKYSNAVDVSITVPIKFALEQNFPNPFNPATTIKFEIPEVTQVNLSVFNILGEKVRELKNEVMKPGYYEIEFSAEGNASSLASGIYVYRIKAGDFIQTKKMILLK